MEEKAYHLQADMLKALAHPTRLKILELLCDGERCVCEIEPALGRRQPNISQHLAILRASGLVEARKEGVRTIYHITDRRVLAAMRLVPRHRFVRPTDLHLAYADCPLSIGRGQTISQPYIVALMTQLARPRAGGRALDIGTGSGYQAAVLAGLTGEVYSIEILCPLANEARARLARLGYANVEVRCGDGYRGWPEQAPFDAIILAAAPDHIPPALIDQLAPGGHLVLPVGEYEQELVDVEKRPDGSVIKRNVIPVRFVPMTGESERR